jgi:perosamine synthetase
MNIPFHKTYIDEADVAGVMETVRTGWLTMGPKTVRFEEEFARYVGSIHAVSVNSCTAALHLALKVLGVKEGDEIVIPAVTFTATGEVACYFKAKPVMVDVEKDTHNIDVAKIRNAVTSRTRAILPVHYGGQPCDMDEIMELGQEYGLPVIEDAAHALPAWYKGRKVGTIGQMTCFSFYATKTLATGEGGMVTTEKDEWAEAIKVLRLHGINKDAWKRYSSEGNWYYEVIEAGYKYNMTDIHAALGLSQLKKLEWMWQRRQDIAERYHGAFKNCTVITTPHVKSDRKSAWHLYVIKLELDALKVDRAQFIELLKAEGIGTSVHFIPLYRHPFYRNAFGYKPEDFPSSEWVYQRIISLPLFPSMTNQEVDFVAGTILDLVKLLKR